MRRLRQPRYDETLEGHLRHIAAFMEQITDPHTSPLAGTGLIGAVNVRTAGVQCAIYQTLPCGHQLQSTLWITWVELGALPIGLNIDRMRDMLRALSHAAGEHYAAHHTAGDA